MWLTGTLPIWRSGTGTETMLTQEEIDNFHASMDEGAPSCTAPPVAQPAVPSWPALPVAVVRALGDGRLPRSRRR